MPERRARSTAGPVRKARSPATRGDRAGRRPRPVRAPVRILFLDVDGTLTDGRITFDAHGDSRHFWIRDGIALEWARELDVLPVVISGRESLAVEARMHDLRLEYHLGARDKVAVAERVLAREDASWNECAMVGDDLPDVPLMRRVGWPIAVGDAHREVKRAARIVVRAGGGRGAVREAVERILAHNGTWERILRKYGAR
jgi:3-deoxy-D-manno-octulosonate 8-phosphate phosphatase (KDO 8-P phosphatase)